MRKNLLRLLFITITILGCNQLTAQIQAISASDGEFENVTSTFLANGWTEAQPSDNKRWRVGTPAGSVAGGTKSAYMGNPGAYNGTNANLILHFYRDVFIPAGATNVLLNYYYRQPVTDNAADYFYVFTTTTAYTPLPNVMPGVGYTQRFVNTATAYPAFTVMPTVDLTALAGTTIRLVYTFNSDGIAPDANPAVDNVTLSYIPVLPPPCTGTPLGGAASATPAVGNVSSAFTLNSPGATIGLGTTYQWQSSPDGIAWANIPGATTLSYGATAVGVATTTYYRLIVTCTASGLSAISSVTTFVTTLVYCIPTTTNLNIGEEIEFVSFVGTLNDVTNTSTSTGAYENFTGLSNRAVQEQGEGINVSVGARARSTQWRAWIDWNRDGDFADGGEDIYTTAGARTLTTSFGYTIPLTQTLGNYRIRIRTYDYTICSPACGPRYGGLLAATEWCGNKLDGQTEDYLFTVVARCPSRIMSVTGDTKCSVTPTTFTLCATATGSSTYFNWYDQQYGGTLLGSTPLTCFTTPTISANNTYWVTAGNAGCQAPGRVPVVAAFRPVPVLSFSSGSPVTLCGDGTGTPPVSVTSTTETADIINENFEGGTLGAFTVTGTVTPAGLAAAEIAIMQWANNTSILLPAVTAVWKPAISSGFGANKFALSIRDRSTMNPYELATILTSPVVSSATFTNLFLSFDIFYSHYLGDNINTFDDTVSVQASINGGVAWNTLALYNADQGYGTRFSSKVIAFPAGYLNQPNLMIRFMYHGEWVDGAALDNIRLYGDKPITGNFIWSAVLPNTGGNMYSDAAFTVPYGGGSISAIYIKPTTAQVLAETDLDFRATATLSNGCSASGTLTVKIGENIWTGAVSTNWNLAGNWCQSTLPSINSRVRIPNVPNKPVVLTGNIGNARFLTIDNASSVTVDPGGTLQIKRDLNSLPGSAFTNNGTLNMIGSEAGQNQTFPGSGTIASMNNLTINNTSAGNQVLLNNAVSIRGELRPTAGDLNLQGNDITLKSNSTATGFVSTLTGTANFLYGTGRFTVERFIGVNARRWQFLAWPVQNENTLFSTWQESGNNANGFGTILTSQIGAINGYDAFSYRPGIKYYLPATNLWEESTALGSTNITAITSASNKQGYMVFVRGNRTAVPSNSVTSLVTLRTKGRLNTGTLANWITVPANKFQSVSNPYACAVNAESMLLNASNTTLQKGFAAWDPRIPGLWNLGGFVTMTQATGWNPTVTGYHYGANDRYVRHGQAFMVQNLTGTAVNLSFEETNKHNAAAVNNYTLQRGARISNEVGENTPRLHAQLNTQAGAGADGNYVAFHDVFLNTEDQYDFGKMQNFGENFSVRTKGKIFAVDARKPLALNDTVFYNTSGMLSATYRLRFAPFNLRTTDLEGVLIDKFLGTKTRISLADTTYAIITFTADPVSKAADRFYLIFRRQEGPLPNRFLSIAAYKNADNLTNHTEWKMADEQGISYYDLERSNDGINFTVFKQNIPATGAGTYSRTDVQPLKGVNFYRVKAYNLSGVEYYSGIAKIGEAGTIAVYPNPVRDGDKINVSFNDMAAGMYKLLLTNKAGQVIFKQDVNIIGDQNAGLRVSGKLSPGTYQIQIAGKNNIVLFIKEVIIL